MSHFRVQLYFMEVDVVLEEYGVYELGNIRMYGYEVSYSYEIEANEYSILRVPSFWSST